MGIEILDQIELANGIAMIIIDVIAISLGLIIMSKYRKIKSRPLLLVGFTIIGLSSPWWPGAISFLLIAMGSAPLTAEVYFIIGNIFIPVAVVTWLAGFTELKYPDKEKIVTLIALITSLIYLIIFFYYLGEDITMIGELKGKNGIDVLYNNAIVGTYYISLLALVLVTGYLFARTSMKSGDAEIELKGKLLLIAFILYVIGGLLDTLLFLDIPTLIIIRGFELASVIVFYWGFVLPTFMKKIFIRE